MACLPVSRRLVIQAPQPGLLLVAQCNFCVHIDLTVVVTLSRPLPCLACPPARLSSPCSCVLMCHAPKKEYYKKFLFEPLPGGEGGRGKRGEVAQQLLPSH